MKRNTLVLLVVILAVSAVGLYAAYQYFTPKPAEELRVFAAASLTVPFQSLQSQFESKYNAKLIFNFAGSSTLSTQIIHGSPCDVFASANTKEMTNVKNANLLSGSSTVFAHNSIIVIVAKNDTKVSTLLDLAKPGVRIVMADKSVPAGNYALQILTKIDATWGNSSSPLYKGDEYVGFSKKVLANVISYETDVEQVVTKTETGTADAGLAYKSDAINRASEVNFIEIPGDINLIAIYPIGIITTTSHAVLAQKFIDYVMSSDGQKALADAGFLGP
ncbi:MAG: molybdate ABC transporter substrate-binding protein [Candidatus Bathyarchaeia archaeon]|jgi:molybdate transport system substrate-binding protein